MKSVLISGADRGVGLGLAAEFASHGWRVFAGQFMPEWPQLSDLKEKYPDNLVIVPLDVSSSESVRAARELVGRETDRIDLLASNAGIGHLKEDRDAIIARDRDTLYRLLDEGRMRKKMVDERWQPRRSL